MTHEGEETFGRVADRLLSEERPVSRTHHISSFSSARIEGPIRDQIAGISALVEDALTRLLPSAGGSTKSSPYPVVIGTMQTVVDRAVASAHQGFSFITAVEQAVQNMALRPHGVNANATRIIDSPRLQRLRQCLSGTRSEKMF